VAAIKMPKNHFLRFGVYVVAACALLWLGAVVLAKLIQVFIYIGIGGIALIVIGVLMEWMKSKKAVANATAPVPMASNTANSTYLDDFAKLEKEAAEKEL
jgi:hypothetical protein